MFGRSALLAATNSGDMSIPMRFAPSLWLDASDSSSVTTVSGAVSQWSDKSGYARHATQATGGYRPAYVTGGLNGLNVISFNGSGGPLSLASNPSLGTQYSIYVVVKNNNLISSTSSLQMIFSSTSPKATFLIAGGSWTTQITDEVLAWYSDSISGRDRGYARVNSGITANTLLVSLKWNTSSLEFIGRINGASDFGVTANFGGFNSSYYPTNIQNIGGYAVNSNIWNGLFCEVIVVPTYQSLSDTQIVEGYLAWKWGFQESLPAGHSFKTQSPVLNP